MTKQLEALISSEIADFFAGFVEIHTELGGPNTVEEAQQQLTERVTRIASECEAALIASLEQSQRESDLWRREALSNLNSSSRYKSQLDASQLVVKLPSLKQTESSERYVWADGVYNFKQDVVEALRAAGITVQGDE